MSAINPFLNLTLNQIHVWSEPDQNPMKRMFLTRFAEISSAGIELCLIAKKILELASLVLKNLFHPFLKVRSSASFYPYLALELTAKAHETAQLVKGFASTVFFGMIFSPEANFKIHLRLKLVKDCQAEKTQKERSAKLQAELQKSEITNKRNERFAQLEVQQSKAEDQIVHRCLVELLQERHS